MRRFTSVVLLVTAALLCLPSPPLYACGDKLMSIARNIRLQHSYKARHPASVLMYAGRAVDAQARGMKDPLVQMSLLYMSLRLAGHKPRAASTMSELDEALTIGRFDLILADIAEVAEVSERVKARNLNVMVLPVVYKLGKADFSAAEQRFKFVLRTPATSVQHLKAVDAAMNARASIASND